MPEINLEITSIAQDGRGIGRCHDPAFPDWADMAVFARGALPGQLARIRIDKVKNNFAEGHAIGLVRDNPEFVEPFCANYGLCGGCPLQRMPYARQLEWKAVLAKDALTRQGKMDPGFVDEIFEPPCPSPGLQSCRNKMEFAFGEDAAGKLVLGQRRQGSLEVVPSDSCPLLPDGHAEILREIVRLANNSGLPAWNPPERRAGSRGKGFWRHLVLRQGRQGDKNAWLALCITSPGKNSERKIVCLLGESLLARFPNLAGFVHDERRQDDLWRHGGKRITVAGQSTIIQETGGRKFELDAASFSQVNPEGANLLASLVCEMTKGGGKILDLYCGIGAPGQLLAPRFTGLEGVDSQKSSIALAMKNAADLPHCSYKVADVDKFLQKNSERRWQTILVDPPRCGLGEKAVKNIIAARPEQIVYISCNPVTFARDAAMLKSAFELRRLSSVDLFPHTPHLECCSLWLPRHEN